MIALSFPSSEHRCARVTQPDGRTFQQLGPAFKLGHCGAARPRVTRRRENGLIVREVLVRNEPDLRGLVVHDPQIRHRRRRIRSIVGAVVAAG